MDEDEILDGKYRLGTQIGEGSLGRVYEARHTSLARTAAIKVFRGDLIEHAGGPAQFLADAKAASKVRHRNIVDVYEFGCVDERIVYVAMERIEGRSLQAYLEQHGRIPWVQARGFALQIVAALKAAHRRRVLHRGLKATNCFLLDNEDPLRIKIGDFAIVRTGAAKLAPGADQTSVFLGDPAYAAPEISDNAEPSVRSDLYAVGILLFHILTGELPFTGKTPFEVILGHAKLPVPSPRDKEPSIPEPVEQIILRTLAKDPDERFESARELELALQEVPPDAGAPPPDVPGEGTEEQETGARQGTDSPGRDEAMHAAFERRGEDEGESQDTSMFARSQLFPYYQQAARDIQTAQRPSAPPVPLPVPPAPVLPPPPMPTAAQQHSAPVPPESQLAGVTPAPLPAFVSSAPLTPPANVSPTPAAAVVEEATVQLVGGGLPSSSLPDETALFEPVAFRARRSEATAVFERMPDPVETTKRVDLLERPVVVAHHDPREQSVPDTTVALASGGVPMSIARRGSTSPAPRAVVPTVSSLPVPRPAVLPGPAQSSLAPLPVRATTDGAMNRTTKRALLGLATVVGVVLVGLGIACPARAAVVDPVTLAIPVVSMSGEPGVSNAHD